MADTPQRIALMFPKLDDAQIARLEAFGRQRQAQTGEVILNQGDFNCGVFVVVDGAIEVVNVSGAGESVIHVLGRGEFTGEVNLLSGRRSLVRLRASAQSPG